MKISSYTAQIGSSHTLQTLNRSGANYTSTALNEKSAISQSLQSDQNSIKLNKIQSDTKQTEQEQIQTLKGTVTAGLFKHISNVISAKNSINKSSEILRQNGDEISSNLNIQKEQITTYNSTGMNIKDGNYYGVLKDYEYEEVKFSLNAQIKTAEKSIDVAINVSLKRSFAEFSKVTAAELNLSDPLVLSLNSNLPEVSSDKFDFDIDSDGTAWQISKLKDSSGFLALDKDNDGKINNGNELFGTKSGNGFADLAEYDSDGNGWIDESDPIFHKLRIWLKTDEKDELVALGEVGVGAIFLSSAKSEFKMGEFSQNAQLKSSGFFVFENGSTGLISQIDLVKQKAMKPSQVNKILTQDSEPFKIKTFNDLLKQNEIKPNENEPKLHNKNLKDQIQRRIRQLQNKMAQSDPKEAKLLSIQIMSLQSQLIDANYNR